MKLPLFAAALLLTPTTGSLLAQNAQPAPQLILHHAKVVTVDADFSIHQAIAVADGRIVAVGTNDAIQQLAGAATQSVDVGGRTILPGLIDSHVHPGGASSYEFDHPVPDVETIADVLAYIQSRAEALPDGAWVRVQQMFITRLKEQRFPTREELDRVAPKNPVIYRTGPDLAVNSLALSASGIGEDFQLPAGASGRIERDAQGKLNGIIRGAAGIIKYQDSQQGPSEDERAKLLSDLIADYNSVGITSISDRNAGSGAVELYERLRQEDRLTARVFLYHGVNPDDSLSQIRSTIEGLAKHPLHEYDDMLWLRGIKVFLDGGMLTGSAYMQQPWGTSEIYSIIDPQYRGTLKIQPERLYQIAKMAIENELQMTAHSVGDAAVANLIDAYEQVDRTTPVRAARPCITHCNFMSAESIERMQRLGIVADLQPAWLWLDGKTLRKQFGDERMRYFQPYRSLFESQVVVGGGSDHMQKIGSLRSVNPYNPFLGMWITIRRQPRGGESELYPQESLTREQAIRLYTINNAFLSFEEQHKGSIEKGKLADFVVLKQDILTCPEDQIKDIQVQSTYLGGKKVYEAEE